MKQLYQHMGKRLEKGEGHNVALSMVLMGTDRKDRGHKKTDRYKLTLVKYVYQSTFEEHLSPDIIDAANTTHYLNVTLRRMKIIINTIMRVIIW